MHKSEVDPTPVLVESNVTEILTSGCEASTEHNGNYRCEYALDMVAVTDWATYNEAVNSWIKVCW